jgi:cytochrome P450
VGNFMLICVQNPKSVAADDTFPDGTVVKKGEFVMYAAYAMGRMPSLWGPDATEFKPERWLVDGVVQPESPFKFAAFQVLQQICDSLHSFFLGCIW